MQWVVLIVLLVVLNALLVLRHPLARFWRIAARHPDEVLEQMRGSAAWAVFDTGLPPDFRSKWPKDSWLGPFRLDSPRLGRRVEILGRQPDYRDDAARILKVLAARTDSPPA